MLGEKQKAAAAELAQWWEGVRPGGIGSHAVLLAAPDGWGRSTVLNQLHEIVSSPDVPVSLAVRVDGRSLPDAPRQQAQALRDYLLGPGVRRQAAMLLCRGLLCGKARPGAPSLAGSGLAGSALVRPGLAVPGLAGSRLVAVAVSGAVSLLLAGLAAAATGAVPDAAPASEDGTAARAARAVAAVSASVPAVVIVDDADRLDPGLAVTVIENLISHPDSRVLVVAAVGPGSGLAAALAARARRGKTTGRVHRSSADPRMGPRSRAELAGQLSPELTTAQAQQMAEQTRTFADVFDAARPRRLS